MKKSALQIVFSYFTFLRKSKSKYGIHSPFLFDLIEAIGKQKKETSFPNIEAERSRLLQDQRAIEGMDYGAGSRKKGGKTIQQIAKTALKKKREATVLYAIAKHLKCIYILELGTSLGISTSYLANSNKDINLVTMEGNLAIAREARKVFENVGLEKIKLVEGNIDHTLSEALAHFNKLDFVFIDANHKKEPCLRYFSEIMPKCGNETVIVLDDIHWSDEMEEAWEHVQKHERVRVTVDLFHFGLVFFRSEMTPQHFTIRV